MTYQARQGDLLIERIDNLPPEARPRDGLVLAGGEATGHTHRLDGGLLFEHAGELYFRASAAVTLWHEEHGPIPFGPGAYQVQPQREYTPQAPRRVAD